MIPAAVATISGANMEKWCTQGAGEKIELSDSTAELAGDPSAASILVGV